MTEIVEDDYFETVSEKDTEYLLSTLQEYADGLRRNRERLDFVKIQAVIFVGSIFSLYASVSLLLEVFRGKIPAVLADSQPSFLVLVLIVASTFSVAMTFIYFLSRVRRLRRETRRLKKIVMQLLRRASQIRDRGYVSFSKRILMDIQLSDVEFLILEDGGVSLEVFEAFTDLSTEIAQSVSRLFLGSPKK